MAYGVIIDDKWLTANSLSKLVRLLGVNCEIAQGARAGVQLIRKRTPDVIFLDIHMPGVDGLEFLKYIHSQPQYAEIPIFVITSDDQPETAHQALESGARAVLIKPASLDELESVLKEAQLIP